MRLYDLVLVLNTSLSEADRKKVIDQIKTQLKDVKVVKEEDWGQKPLSYPIKKENAGVYVKLNLETEASVPKDFETQLTRNNNVLRHLLLRTK
ncbi:MAG TPA: 30S ribosomal protein S6 [Patescibacteria group bacterium]|nr:30S ribosomal protein S6 [Patescibacteria group bacterium]